MAEGRGIPNGSYIITAVGCDLAADAIGRQGPISVTLRNYRTALGERPDLLLIAVPPGTSNDLMRTLGPVLDGTNPRAGREVGGEDA